MNILKKSLAMFLVLCMLIGAIPMTAFATDIDSTEPTVTEPVEEATETTEVATEAAEETTEPAVETTEATEESTEATEETLESTEETTEATEETTETAEETTEPTVDPYGLSTLSLDDELSVASTTISTITMGTNPGTGSTSGEPFPQGTAGSNSFRIPTLVTLSNGNLVAAADARWNTTYDGGGLDTIVARSYDSGANWSYSFANYLGDNGNEYNGSGSTAFIDPALAVSGNTVYMLCDLYPYGVALNGSVGAYPSTSVGFNSDGKLLLSGDNHSSYSYYLDGDAIYSSDGTKVEGYTVDEYFNITADDGTTSNLFFSNSPYKVVRTGFLYLTKSTDAGATWSAPELLDLKTSSEQVCLVGPGRGLVTSSGMIVFPTYSYNGSQNSQTTSFIYSNDGGSTWNRSANFTGATWSSESAVVELESGALRFFYGDGATAQDLLDNGPKNELYLYTGQTLTFKVNTSRIMQIGLKAPQGATTASITVNNGTATTQAVNSSVDMFYDLVSAAAGSDTEYTVSITNTGSSILSVTLLKVCDDPSFAFAILTAEDIENVLTGVYGLVEEETETPSEPYDPEEETPTEPSEPEIPEETTEPETEPAKPTKPSKPGKPDSNKPGNSNRPGHSAEDTESEEAEAVLNIVFINLWGKKVGAVTLAETGNENDRCVFSASEISAQAPDNYRALWFFPAIVSYGDTATIIVTVL